MTIEKVKEMVSKNTNQPLKFKFNGSRNQVEEFSGKIVEAYPAIFIIETLEENVRRKSFSYSDILTESLEIIK